jgi:hypothetical protein
MKLAIKGHKERGKEVIELLEMLGGKNTGCLGFCSSAYYHIDNGIITSDRIVSNHYLYTLEHFEQKYPYKVGEKVLYLNGRKEWVEGIIDKMIWNDNNNALTYYVNNIDGTSAGPATIMFLKSMKQKELKDYLKPGYVVEYDDGSRFVITQDVHGNNFGLQIGKSVLWSSLVNLELIDKVYQINKPGALHDTCIQDHYLTLVWEKPKEVELTMQQIADKFGIDVNQLKIKK